MIVNGSSLKWTSGLGGTYKFWRDTVRLALAASANSEIFNMGSQAPNIDSVSLGMVIIDELRFANRETLTNVTGGSASFVTLGCRLFADPSDASNVGCLVMAGNDFSETVEQELRDWGMTLVIEKNEDAPSTRGLLEYGDDTFGREFCIFMER